MADASTKFCPKCSSPLVSFSVLDGPGTGTSAASCGACSWKGALNELLSVPFQHDFTSDEAMLHQLKVELRNTIAKGAGTDLAKMLMRWGFVSLGAPEVMKVRLSRLLEAVATGALRELLLEREKIEKEGGR